ncbi:MAG: DNA-binding protein [Pedosphaera sp.]|nr:DNA-binding protein [Pedosphaera sp.]
MNDQPQPPNDSLLRKKEVAQMLACSTRTIERLVSCEKLTPVKILGAIRFRLSQVQAIINGGLYD